MPQNNDNYFSLEGDINENHKYNLHFMPGMKIFEIYLVSINVSVQVYDPFINIH